MPETSTADAKQDILELKHLPPLSVTATRLLETVANPDVDIAELSYIISQDPGLMARIIGLANAAYFGQAVPITTVHDAIVRVLGINMVKSLAISLSVSGPFKAQGCSGFSTRDYWFSSIGCATLARMMALRVPAGERPDPEKIYLSGLLHNLGWLVLAHLFPSKLSYVLALKKKDPEANMIVLQEEHIGVDWVSAGKWLVNRWHLPDFVGEVIGSVFEPDHAGKAGYDVTMIRCSLDWLSALRKSGDTPPGLTEYTALTSISGLVPNSLARIEDKFLDTKEELEALASSL